MAVTSPDAGPLARERKTAGAIWIDARAGVTTGHDAADEDHDGENQDALHMGSFVQVCAG